MHPNSAGSPACSGRTASRLGASCARSASIAARSTAGRADRSNVATLEPAWTFDASRHADGSQAAWLYPVQANPVVARGLLYVPTPDDAVVALDAATGELRWEYRAEARPGHRGLVFWEGDGDGGQGDGAAPPRLYFLAGKSLVALDARTGLPDPGFGTQGRAPVRRGTAAPAIADDQILVAINKPAALHAFDLRSGEHRWETPLLHYGGQNTGCSPWGGFSVDTARGLAFVTTGNPRPSMYGGGRAGDNPHCNSIVAIDTRDGEIVWTFQEVAHDLWNFDIAAPPALTTIEVKGETIDVVAAATKIGNTILLERDSGQPVFDYRLRRAPASRILNEVTAAYQPDLELPEPLMDVAFEEDDISDIGAVNEASIRWQLERGVFGFFAPPEMGATVVTFGLHGGTGWPGVAVDPDTGWLYAPINRIPWKLRFFLRPRTREPPPASEAGRLYAARCAQCHGPDRQGDHRAEGEAEIDYVPSLVGTSHIEGYEEAYRVEHFRRRHERAAVPTPSEAELDQLRAWFAELDEGRSTPDYSATLLIDHEGYPGSKPPWGEIVALDLATGRIQWRTPFGEYPELTRRGLPKTGQPNYGGLIATRGGLVFATGTIDRKLRALDSRTGAELWAHELPAAGSAPPTTYEIAGRQYIAVVATGGRFHGFERTASIIQAFTLP
jgi:quinoprotein glucose dehydrogenase